MKKVSKAKPNDAVDKEIDARLNESNARAARRLIALQNARPEPPEFVLSRGKSGAVGLRFDSESDAVEKLNLHASLGFKNTAAVNLLVEQLLRLSAAGIEEQDATRLNRTIAMLDELAPNDGPEGMLAAQMVAVHDTAMQCFSRANIEGQTFAGRELNLKHGAKLIRAFAQQLQALDKHRRNGQQQVVVKHVHVNEGGQAIVGNVSTGRGA